MADVSNAATTASVQWLERSLDDSANRRISMPEAFLCADAVLRLVIDVVSGLRVNEKIIEKALNEYMPFFATENILMEGVKRGGDRQKLHETIRVCSMEASQIRDVLNPELYIGRCPEQVSGLVEKIRLEIGENKA